MSVVKETAIVVPATLDTQDFIRFALFNTFSLKKRWKSPVLFAVLMSIFAVICFVASRTHPQGTLLGSILLSIGLILPIVWFLLFLSSIKAEAKKHGLSKTKAQYFTLLRQDSIKVVKEKEEAVFPWQDLFMAYRVKGCIYLYINPDRAYLLPDCDDSDLAWELICSSLPKEKQKDLR